MAVNKTMEEEKLRKKGWLFHFQFFFTHFQGWYLEEPLRRCVPKDGGLAERYGGFEGKKKQNQKTLDKEATFFLSFSTKFCRVRGMFSKEVQLKMRVMHVNKVF